MNYKSEAAKYIKQQETSKLNKINLLQRATDIIFSMTDEKVQSLVLSLQMTASKGIKLYGEVAVSAMIKEFKQLINRLFPGKPVVEAIELKDLTEKDRKTALDTINLIKIKKNGVVKGRTCANGSRERYYSKEGDSIASPTTSLEAIISTLLIDVYEEREVAIFDIPGAYLHASMPDEHKVILRIKGQFVNIMCMANPEFQKYVIIENGIKVLYLKV